ncbi:hypothetical protein [Mesorhizobium sp. 10J20-29]
MSTQVTSEVKMMNPRVLYGSIKLPFDWLISSVNKQECIVCELISQVEYEPPKTILLAQQLAILFDTARRDGILPRCANRRRDDPRTETIFPPKLEIHVNWPTDDR